MLRDTWHHAYDEPLTDVIVPEAFAHPAKMSWALAKRLMRHIRRHWPQIASICDPMAGIGIVPLAAAYAKFGAFAGELEAHFIVRMTGMTCAGVTQTQWVRYWAKGLHRARRAPGTCPACQEGLRYESPHARHGYASWIRAIEGSTDYSLYASMAPPEPQQITLWETEKPRSAIPTRAPHRYQGSIERHVGKLRAQGKPVPVVWRHDAMHLPLRRGEMGIVASPPYGDSAVASLSGGGLGKAFREDKRGTDIAHDAKQRGYGTHPAQIGHLAVLSSPPYANQIHNAGTAHPENFADPARVGKMTYSQVQRTHYGRDARQLQRRGYWDAMRHVYGECARILAPGAPLLLVLKGHIEHGQYVDLPAQTAVLLEQCGFQVVHWHQVSLVAREAQRELFVEEYGEESRRQRKSFFRRLAEKNGAPPIDHEVVLCAERCSS